MYACAYVCVHVREILSIRSTCTLVRAYAPPSCSRGKHRRQLAATGISGSTADSREAILRRLRRPGRADIENSPVNQRVGLIIDHHRVSTSPYVLICPLMILNTPILITLGEARETAFIEVSNQFTGCVNAWGGFNCLWVIQRYCTREPWQISVMWGDHMNDARVANQQRPSSCWHPVRE